MFESSGKASVAIDFRMMFASKTCLLLALALVASIYAAPPADEDPECRPSEEELNSKEVCCKLKHLLEESKESAAFKECLALAHVEMPTEGDHKSPPPEIKPDGYKCMEDCIFDKLGLLTSDKAMDLNLVASTVKESYTDDWASVGSAAFEKCKSKVASSTSKCSSGADVMILCLARETFLNCPSSLWTESDRCTKSKERLIKCPKALPFGMCKHKKS